ncbi:MAG: DNA-binding protein [Planctomycetota bacterium]|nr:MAG: DNA-binding protein [Planctomycetota bacterium]
MNPTKAGWPHVDNAEHKTLTHKERMALTIHDEATLHALAAQRTIRPAARAGRVRLCDRTPSLIDPLLTYRQAATVLGVTDRTVWTLVDRGELPAVRFGRSVRIDPADLRAFIDRSKRAESAGGAR